MSQRGIPVEIPKRELLHETRFRHHLRELAVGNPYGDLAKQTLNGNHDWRRIRQGKSLMEIPNGVVESLRLVGPRSGWPKANAS